MVRLLFVVIFTSVLSAPGCDAGDPATALVADDGGGVASIDDAVGAPGDSAGTVADGASEVSLDAGAGPVETALPTDWGPMACPDADGVSVGFGVGEQLVTLGFRTCEDELFSLDALCGADALWLFLPHGWCPHCVKTSGFQEQVHDALGGVAAGLASVNIIVEDNKRQKPTAEYCRAWRDAHGHEDVITLYDPTGAALSLWSQNYTALNVFVNRERVIQHKLHTDDRVAIEGQVQALLNQARGR